MQATVSPYTASLNDGAALPGWLSFDGLTQTFSGTPGNDEWGCWISRSPRLMV